MDKELLVSGLGRIGAPSDERTEVRLERFISEIMLFNPALKLVGDKDPDEIIIRHVLDSAAAYPVFMKETALIIQQQLKEINVNLDVQPVENSGFFEIVFADGDDYELYLNGYGAVGDPDNIVAGMYDGTWGINLEVSDEVAQLWADGRATSDETERAAIYKELQQKAVEDMSVYTIAYPNYVFATTANLKGTDTIKTTPIFEDYTKLYFED